MAINVSPSPDERLAYKREEAAQVVGVSLATIDRLIASGELPVVRFGTAVRVTREALKSWLEEHEA